MEIKSIAPESSQIAKMRRKLGNLPSIEPTKENVQKAVELMKSQLKNWDRQKIEKTTMKLFDGGASPVAPSRKVADFMQKLRDSGLV